MKKLIIISAIISLAICATAYFAYPYLFPQKKQRIISHMLPGDIKADSIIVFKEKREMILLSKGKELKRYSISLGKNPEGHKMQEGDKKTPEGAYRIEFKNSNSKYHLSLRISYPSSSDKQNAESRGVDPGSDIMIHGLPNNMGMLEDYYLSNDWTDGCIAVSNQEIEEIWNAVDVGIPIMINK